MGYACAPALALRLSAGVRPCSSTCRKPRKQVETLERELDDDPAASSSREHKARARAAADRKSKLERALEEMPKVEEAKARNPPKKGKRATEARVSTTDPEARVMKMGDGGWRPAYSIQLATDTESRFIVGVDATNIGSDTGQILPILDQLEERLGKKPDDYLADGSYAKLTDVHALEEKDIRLFAPVPTPRREGIDPHARKPGDTDLTAAWRARMVRRRPRRSMSNGARRSRPSTPISARIEACNNSPSVAATRRERSPCCTS